MAMFDSLKDTLNKSVAAVSVKSETLVESSRVKSMISNAQKRLEAEKEALGVKLYQNWKAGALSWEIFTEDFARIEGIEGEIEGLNKRLEEIKAEENRVLGTAPAAAKPAAGTVFCTKCGKALPAGSRFCDGCGNPVA